MSLLSPTRKRRSRRIAVSRMVECRACTRALISIVLSSGLIACDRILELGLARDNMTNYFRSLEGADTIEIRPYIGDRAHPEPPLIATITDQEQIREVLSLFKQYPDGWMMFSGAGGYYSLYFYRDRQLLGDVGLNGSLPDKPDLASITAGEHYRRASTQEVAKLARGLGLNWPPH